MSDKARVAIMISGGGSNMLSLIEAMRAPDYPATPVLVLSNRPEAPGLAKAEAMGIPIQSVDHKTFETRAEFEKVLDEHLSAANPDIVCLAGFMRVLTNAFVEKWRGRMLNIHPSLLPLFTGLDTHKRALEAGVAVHGATVHEVIPELDAGRILGQTVIKVEPRDTPESLAARLLSREHALYPAALKRFVEGKTAPFAML